VVNAKDVVTPNRELVTDLPCRARRLPVDVFLHQSTMPEHSSDGNPPYSVKVG
jgi:hypothetical protein